MPLKSLSWERTAYIAQPITVSEASARASIVLQGSGAWNLLRALHLVCSGTSNCCSERLLPSKARAKPHETPLLTILLMLGHTHPYWRNHEPSLTRWQGSPRLLAPGHGVFSLQAVSGFTPPQLSVALLLSWSSLKIILIFLPREERKGSGEGIAIIDH